MKLLLIQLSDIHISSEDDAITERHLQIVDAVKKPRLLTRLVRSSGHRGHCLFRH